MTIAAHATRHLPPHTLPSVDAHPDAPVTADAHRTATGKAGGGVSKPVQRFGQYRDLYPPKRDDAGHWLCRTCGVVLTGRVRSFCSDQCRDLALMRCWSSKVRDMVWRRDKGICAICGLDTEVIERAVHRRGDRLRSIANNYKTPVGRRVRAAELLKRWGEFALRQGWTGRNYRQSAWEADHIVPVVKGGGQCGLDNYRTLCRRCHKAETAALAASRAKERRGILELSL